MAVIIDTNCFANVFNRNSVNHIQFKPVLDWIIYGKGIIVYGGTKYINELKKAPKYLQILRLLRDINKVYLGDLENIDRIQSNIEANNANPDFDDPHLPAIVIDTKCRIICSEDTRSIRFVKDSTLYPEGIQVPCFYTSSRNKDLLCDKYIHTTLKPLSSLNKEQLRKVNQLFENK